jgi:hypothetical protein
MTSRLLLGIARCCVTAASVALCASVAMAIPASGPPAPERTALPPRPTATPAAAPLRYVLTINGRHGPTFSSARGLPAAAQESAGPTDVDLGDATVDRFMFEDLGNFEKIGKVLDIHVLATRSGQTVDDYTLAAAVISHMTATPFGGGGANMQELRIHCTAVTHKPHAP